jgi:hypothetical protein
MKTDFDRITEITRTTIELLKHKDHKYGASWKKRGGSGAFHNLARKWDRLENISKSHDYDIFQAGQATVGDPESIQETLTDLVGYCLLVMERIEVITNLEIPAQTSAPDGMGGYTDGSPTRAYVDQDRQLEQVEQGLKQ